MQRQPAVAGQFYAGNSSSLRSDLAALIPAERGEKKVLGIIAPHAGYVYSGAIAGTVYAAISLPATVLVLGPNHHGAGAAAALYPDGEWVTPLGPVAIDSRLNTLLMQDVPQLRSDSIAHRSEHSLEVQVPFLQYLRPDVRISAVCLGHGDYEAIRQIGEGIATAIREYGDDVLIVASSDMTHYESTESARLKDGMALDRVLAFDPQGLLQVCRDEKISMCGSVPVAVMLSATAELGASHAELVAYGTSGDVTGDDRQVVGYASVMVW
jgi:AmmeMemoRadiSam system protein B